MLVACEFYILLVRTHAAAICNLALVIGIHVAAGSKKTIHARSLVCCMLLNRDVYQ